MTPLLRLETFARPEATLPGVHYLWRTSHHDEFNLELQPGEANMSISTQFARNILKIHEKGWIGDRTPLARWVKYGWTIELRSIIEKYYITLATLKVVCILKSNTNNKTSHRVGMVEICEEIRASNLQLTCLAQIYEKRMPYAFAEYFGRFEKSGAVLFPPPACYQYYENKAELVLRIAMGMWMKL